MYTITVCIQYAIMVSSAGCSFTDWELEINVSFNRLRFYLKIWTVHCGQVIGGFSSLSLSHCIHLPAVFGRERINKRQFALQSVLSFPQYEYRNSTIWLHSLLWFQVVGLSPKNKLRRGLVTRVCVTCTANFIKTRISIVPIWDWLFKCKQLITISYITEVCGNS